MSSGAVLLERVDSHRKSYLKGDSKVMSYDSIAGSSKTAAGSNTKHRLTCTYANKGDHVQWAEEALWIADASSDRVSAGAWR